MEAFRIRVEARAITIQPPIMPDSLSFSDAYDPNREKSVGKRMEACLKPEFGVGFLVVVLPTKDSRLYNTIKRIGDVEVGLSNVCVIAQKMCGPPPCEDNQKEEKRQSRLK